MTFTSAESSWESIVLVHERHKAAKELARGISDSMGRRTADRDAGLPSGEVPTPDRPVLSALLLCQVFFPGETGPNTAVSSLPFHSVEPLEMDAAAHPGWRSDSLELSGNGCREKTGHPSDTRGRRPDGLDLQGVFFHVTLYGSDSRSLLLRSRKSDSPIAGIKYSGLRNGRNGGDGPRWNWRRNDCGEHDLRNDTRL